MDEEAVLEQLAFLAGLDMEEAFACLPLVRMCMGEVERMLRPGVVFSGGDDRLNSLAAALSYKKYCLLREEESVRIGEISLGGEKNRTGAAVRLADEAMAQCADLLRDRDFLFRGTGG